MAGRSRLPPHSMKAPFQPLHPLHDLQHRLPPAHFPVEPRDDPRDPLYRPLPSHFRPGLPHPSHSSAPAAFIEDRMASDMQEVQVLLADNQRLAATHVALKQELAAAHHELNRVSHAVSVSQADADRRLREMHEKSMKMESGLQVVDDIKMELTRVRGDIQNLNTARQDLTAQIQSLTQDLARSAAEAQKVPPLKAEIETLKQEIQHVRGAIEHEKKGYADNYEQGQIMEKNLISIAREVEKLRSEVANGEKRTRSAVPAANQGLSYSMSYGNPEHNYIPNPYSAVYGVGGTGDASAQHGHPLAQGSWAGYDLQRAQGRR